MPSKKKMSFRINNNKSNNSNITDTTDTTSKENNIRKKENSPKAQTIKAQTISSFLSEEKDLEVPQKTNKTTCNNIGEIKEDKLELSNILETEDKLELSNILDTDDKLLFSLNALGDLQKNEKLTEKEELLSVDDRWFFQGLRRWWSNDNQNKSSNKTLEVINQTSIRINKLLDEDFLSQKEENKIPVLIKNNPNQKDKKLIEQNEERRRLINKYFVALSQAKSGMENIKDTYTYKNTKNKFRLSIQKTDDILDKLQKFKG